MEPNVLARTGSGLNLPSLLESSLRRTETDGAPCAVLTETGEPVSEELLPDLTPDALRTLYRAMLRLRAVDQRCLALQRQGRIGFYVPSSGEEAVMIGTAHALQPEDWVFPAYREIGVALYRGYPLPDLLCQLFGNERDYLKGRQMPNHFGSPRCRFAVASSPVGTQIPQAVGAAWASRLRGERSVSLVYFGDGATSTGDFHAGLNLAGVMGLPVVFACKNNGWAISLPRERQTASETLAQKAIAYGMPGVRVDGNDVLAVYQITRLALERARAGHGPTLIEAVTYRLGPHSTADDPTRYRDAGEVETWQQRDPLVRFRRFLAARGYWSDADEESGRAEVEAEIAAAIREVEPLPPPPLETLFTDVYAEMPWHLREQWEELRAVRQD